MIIDFLLLLLFSVGFLLIIPAFFSYLYQKSNNKFVKLLYIVLAVSVYLSIITWMITQVRKENAAKEAQEAQQRLWVEYKAKGHVKPWLSCDKVELQPYLKRPILVINEESLELDELHFQLPSELWPTTPDDIGTVILLKRDVDYVGAYTHGGGAFASICLVRIFDQGEKCMVANTKFSNPPPRTVTRYGRSGFPLSGRGEKPVSEVLNYINGMIKQP